MQNFKILIVVTGLIILASGLSAQTQEEKIEENKYDDYFPTLLAPGDDSLSNLRKLIFDAIHNSSEKQVLVDTIIKDKETAINVSEAILFKIYGKNNIIKQKPYQVFFVDGYWVLSGTLPEKMLGGTFLIVLNAKNGQVIKLTHGK